LLEREIMDLQQYFERQDAMSASKLARAVGVSPQFMSQLRVGWRRCPCGLAIDVEKATKGLVRCEDLVPEIDWGYLRKRRLGENL
jgi:DNA-binding transcriptional regulator YdaS (Cro superfamily)